MEVGEWREKTFRICSPLFLGCLERKKYKVFEGVKEEFDKVRDKCYQLLGCLVTGNHLYSMENFGNFIEILIDV